ncbi:MAG: CDC48 family AAA ATPase [Eubacteriales bacterium]
MDDIFLSVSECSSKDAGRGIARIDPLFFSELGIETGSLIKIIGKKRTAVKAMPSFIDERGKNIIEIDGTTRGNAGVAINDKVQVEKLIAIQAKQIVIEPSRSIDENSNFTKYLAKAMEGQPISEGDVIKVNVFGFINEDFLVKKTEPSDIVVVGKDTAFFLKAGNARISERKITYEDIGGLKKQIGKIREMIELPLKYPDLFVKLGIEPPRGVLLYGPPGSGKTLIARAIANEASTHFVSINGPEIIQKFYGESEANLRKVFDEAKKNAPSIVFIDEIDAIAPKRGDVQGDVEKRVVTQLLTLMDGLEKRGQIVVIGATNMPELLDTALRRPGRFDREIYIGVPDKNGRLEILNVHSRSIPLDDDVDLEKIAEITHGFVGADIANLCREAAMNALAKVLPDIDFNLRAIPYDVIMQLKVNMANFMYAVNQIEPSALREVFMDVPKVTWKDVGGFKKIKSDLENEIRLPLLYPKLFEATGVRPGRGVLLSGPPGTGKTLIAKALANETGINFIYIKGPELLSKWIGESEKGVREVFKKARLASPCIIFFDEIDSLAPKRGSGGGDSGVSERVLSQLLVEIDGIEKRDGIMILAATNRVDILDPALLRSGRFDIIYNILEPCFEDALEIFRIHAGKMPVEVGMHFELILKQINNITGANIENICKKAAMSAIKRYIAEHKEIQYEDISDFIVREEDFFTAIEDLGYMIK